MQEERLLMDFVRPAISSIKGYTPGEQPQESGWIKLNTNENPYPPSPTVEDAVRRAIGRGLQVYPDPHASAFRIAASEVFGVDPDWILPANGSDENLTILLRTFVDPHETITYPYPGYVLYETLGRIQDCKVEPMLLDNQWQFDKQAIALARKSKLVLIPNPNSPTGTLWSNEQLGELVPEWGLMVLDGAYADFIDSPQTSQFHTTGRNVVMTRTLSKSYSLAGLRFGFAIAHPDTIAQMRKVKDSYNCDALAIAAATAAILDQEWMLTNRDRILATRSHCTTQLQQLGFDVTPSQANFLWMRHPSGEHERIYEQLKERRILIRYMKFPLADTKDGPFDGLRVSIGTDEQIQAFLEALRELL